MGESPAAEPRSRRSGNLRILLGIALGGGVGFLGGIAGSAAAGNVRWLGLGLVLGLATGLVLGTAAARGTRN